MTDGQLLLLVLWLVYITDCFVWYNRHTVVFATWWGRKRRALTASPRFGLASGGISLLNPFPPLGQIFIAQALPLSLSPDCVVAFNSQSFSSTERPLQSGTVLAIDELSEVEVRDNDLFLNGTPFCKFRNPLLARLVAELLKRLHTSSQSCRAILIDDFWKQRFDTPSASIEFQLFKATASGLHWLCILLFAFLYLLLPFIALYSGVALMIIPAGIVMFIMAIPLTYEYFIAHRLLFPELRSDRYIHSLKMALCPPVAIRSIDLLTGQSLYKYDILALAHLFLAKADCDDFCASYVRDLRHPISFDSDNPLVRQTCRWQNETIMRLALPLLPSVASAVPRSMALPSRQSADCLSFCPRCLIQLATKDGNCPECSGVPLMPFISIGEFSQKVSHER